MSMGQLVDNTLIMCNNRNMGTNHNARKGEAPMGATTHTITYRKTKAGQWVAYGPAAILRPGEVVVTKRDGSTKVELVERLGRPFEVDGVEMVYGYIAPSARRRTRSYRYEEDHEDCLSFAGGCGPNCPYNFKKLGD